MRINANYFKELIKYKEAEKPQRHAKKSKYLSLTKSIKIGEK
jgi:hypothetical protein